MKTCYLAAIALIALLPLHPPAGGESTQALLQRLQAEKKIIDAHGHLASGDLADAYLYAMDRLGIGKVVVLGSSRFTFSLRESDGFTGYDENNEALLTLAKEKPGRFDPWPAIHPEDGEHLAKARDMAERGAVGFKMYLGHGYVKRDGTYMFHTMAMDDPRLYPFYRFCEERHIPICLHVNPHYSKPGFAQEFVGVLERFPDLKVNAPHYMLSSIQDSRLRELLDTFPNLYTDISFGEYFVSDGLRRISREPEKFRQLFRDYPTRFMFGTDMVVTRYRSRTWLHGQMKAYLDMLTQERYKPAFMFGRELNGLALEAGLLERILFRNYEDFLASKPANTQIKGEVNWWRMRVRPLEREPGDTFPPPAR